MDAQWMKWLIEAQEKLDNFLKNSKELSPLAMYAVNHEITLFVHPASRIFNKKNYCWGASWVSELIWIPFDLESETVFSAIPEESQGCFAHELGHVKTIPEPLNCNVDQDQFLKQFLKNVCIGANVRLCAYEELRAHFKGYEILQEVKLLNESLEKIYWQFIEEVLNKYYKNCLEAVKEQQGRCPREKEVLKMLQEKNLLQIHR